MQPVKFREQWGYVFCNICMCSSHIIEKCAKSMILDSCEYIFNIITVYNNNESELGI